MEVIPILSKAGSYLGPESGTGQDEFQDGYLSELLSYSLDRLNKEPELLRTDAERVRRQMQEVAVSHYRAFIEAAEAVQSIRQEITTVDRHLGTLVSEIPKLAAGCNAFMEDAQHVVEKRRMIRTMLANHPTLLDLLEIPQLMETCVRNQNYDEALDLEACVSKLATMHVKLPVIQSLAEDVKRTTQSMLSQLLQRLRSNIQLPECLRVVGYLRRLAVFSEHEMRLQFLRCREAWLVEMMEEVEQSSAYNYLKRITEFHRMHLFDVVMQYRSIFADDTSGQDEAPDGSLVFSWAMHRVSAYLALLAAVLPKITEGSSLASVLENCMYCGERLGRVGLDFRGLLPPLFEACVRNMFLGNMGVALQSFQLVLDSHRWISLPKMGNSGRTGKEDPSDDVAPPYSLMEHPPLAAFVNGVLAALNELRQCAPTALRSQLASEVARALAEVSEMLVQYHKSRIVRDSEASLFLAMCRAYVDVASPYVVLCFSHCYGNMPNLVDPRPLLEPVRQLLSATPHSPPNSHHAYPAAPAAGGKDHSEAEDKADKAGAAKDLGEPPARQKSPVEKGHNFSEVNSKGFEAVASANGGATENGHGDTHEHGLRGPAAASPPLATSALPGDVGVALPGTGKVREDDSKGKRPDSSIQQQSPPSSGLV